MTAEEPKVVIRVLHGKKNINYFMRAAGLGISGIGVPADFVINWKPGEKVTGLRVRSMMINLVDASRNSPTMETEILHWEVKSATGCEPCVELGMKG